MPMKPSPAADRSPWFGRLCRAISRSPVGREWRRSKGIELGSRSLGFAALGLLTLVPLLIIVSSVVHPTRAGAAEHDRVRYRRPSPP
jgi:membrane protein